MNSEQKLAAIEKYIGESTHISSEDVENIQSIIDGTNSDFEDDELETLVESALDAFWQDIASAYPESTSGDLSPDNTLKLKDAALAAVREWIENNV